MQKTWATFAISSALFLLALATITVFGNATHEAWARTAESVTWESATA